MTRTNEYQSQGGAFEKLEDALSSIDQAMDEVKNVDDATDTEERPSARQMVANIQQEMARVEGEIRAGYTEIEKDPLYLLCTEKIDVNSYGHSVSFFHPVYDHVWITEGDDRDVARELLPFIVYEMTFDLEGQAVVAKVIYLDTQLNLPDFKSSVKAATVDLEILKGDAKRVGVVTNNAKEGVDALNKALGAVCEQHDMVFNMVEEHEEFAIGNDDQLAIRQAAIAQREAERQASKERDAKAKKEADAKAKKAAAKAKKAADAKAKEEAEAAAEANRLREIALANSRKSGNAPAEAKSDDDGPKAGPPKAKRAEPPAPRVSVPPPLPRK